MKGLYVSLLVIAVVAFSVSGLALGGPQSECPDICTFEYLPVCGYDGKCYHSYGNECVFKSERCKNKQDMKMVDMEMCDEALAKTNPEVLACPEE